MKKRIFVVAGMVVAITLLLSACGRKETPEAAGPQAAERTEKIETGIIIPEGTYKECPALYFSKEKDGAMKDCNDYGGGRVCSYYKETKGGQEKIKNLEYLTECHACRFYGPQGVADNGTVRSELLGLEKKECWQGMYQN